MNDELTYGGFEKITEKNAGVSDIIVATIVSGLNSLVDTDKVIVIDGQNYNVVSAKSINGSVNLRVSKAYDETMLSDIDKKFIEKNIKDLKNTFYARVKDALASYKQGNSQYVYSAYCGGIPTGSNKDIIEGRMNKWLEQYGVKLTTTSDTNDEYGRICFSKL